MTQPVPLILVYLLSSQFSSRSLRILLDACFGFGLQARRETLLHITSRLRYELLLRRRRSVHSGQGRTFGLRAVRKASVLDLDRSEGRMLAQTLSRAAVA